MSADSKNPEYVRVKVEKKFKAKVCSVSVTYYDKNGRIVNWNYFSSMQETDTGCALYQQSVINDLTNQGYIVKMQ